MTPKGTTTVLLNVAAQALFFLMSGRALSTGCEAEGILLLEHGPCQYPAKAYQVHERAALLHPADDDAGTV